MTVRHYTHKYINKKRFMICLSAVVISTTIALYQTVYATNSVTEVADISDINTVTNNKRGINANKQELMGKCHLFNQQPSFIDVIDKGYDESDKFKFVVYQRNLDKVVNHIHATQLINIQRQLVVADSLYQQTLRLKSPLQSNRYHQANSIHVEMRPMKGNGVAFDEVVADKKLGLADCHLAIGLRYNLSDKNGTPAHELFHLYQSSYFMFKNAWLTEGTARWSESLMVKGYGKQESLPKNKAELMAVMQQSYSASTMWTRLFRLVDEQSIKRTSKSRIEIKNISRFQIPRTTVNSNHYLAHHKPNSTTQNDSIVKDNQAYGTDFIEVLFTSLTQQSKQASIDRGFSIYNWQEKQQKSADNNPYIWRAIQDAVNSYIPIDEQSEELRRFMRIEL